jgi:uncharacterized protein YdhG (YjbR/CyaY superfamily)
MDARAALCYLGRRTAASSRPTASEPHALPTPPAAPQRSSSAATDVPRTIDDYIASSPAEVRPVLEAVRATVRAAAPAAEERISYGIPAFFLDGALVYFAAFKAHIGFYPPVTDAALLPLLAKYAGPKGNLRFPLSEPMPHALIARIVEARIGANRARKAAGTGDGARRRATPPGSGCAATRDARAPKRRPDAGRTSGRKKR